MARHTLHRCRANLAHIRQSWPESGLGLEAKVFEMFEVARGAPRVRAQGRPGNITFISHNVYGLMVLERQLLHEIINLLFTITN